MCLAQPDPVVVPITGVERGADVIDGKRRVVEEIDPAEHRGRIGRSFPGLQDQREDLPGPPFDAQDELECLARLLSLGVLASRDRDEQVFGLSENRPEFDRTRARARMDLSRESGSGGNLLPGRQGVIAPAARLLAEAELEERLVLEGPRLGERDQALPGTAMAARGHVLHGKVELPPRRAAARNGSSQPEQATR